MGLHLGVTFRMGIEEHEREKGITLFGMQRVDFLFVIVVVGKWRVVIHIDLSYSLFMLEFVGWKRLKRIDVPIEG